MQVLRENRTERSARHDDRPLSAERTTGADTDRRRNRLQQGNIRVDAAAPGEDRLYGLGHAVTTDLLRTEPRHDADHHTATDWSAQNQPPRMVLRSWCHQVDGPSLVENEVRDQPDQPQQAPRRGRRQRADGKCQRRGQQHAPVDREVCEARAHENTWSPMPAMRNANPRVVADTVGTSISASAARSSRSRLAVTLRTVATPFAVSSRSTTDALTGLPLRDTRADIAGRNQPRHRGDADMQPSGDCRAGGHSQVRHGKQQAHLRKGESHRFRAALGKRGENPDGTRRHASTGPDPPHHPGGRPPREYCTMQSFSMT